LKSNSNSNSNPNSNPKLTNFSKSNSSSSISTKPKTNSKSSPQQQDKKKSKNKITTTTTYITKKKKAGAGGGTTTTKTTLKFVCRGRHERTNAICRSVPENFNGCTIYCKHHIIDTRYTAQIKDIQKKNRHIEILKNVAQKIVTNINFFNEHASDISTMNTFPYDKLPLSPSKESESELESESVQQSEALSEPAKKPEAAAAALVAAVSQKALPLPTSTSTTTSPTSSLLLFDQSITYLNKHFPPLKSKLKGSGEYGRHSVPRSLLHETDDIYAKLVIVNYWRQLSQKKQIYLKDIMKYYYIHPTENNDRMTSIKFNIIKDIKLLTCKIELIDDDDDINSKKIKSTAGDTIIAASCPKSYNSIGIGLVGEEEENKEKQNSFTQAIDNLSKRVPFFYQSIFKLNKLERIIYTAVPSSSKSKEDVFSWNDSQCVREAFPPLRLDDDIEDGLDDDEVGAVDVLRDAAEKESSQNDRDKDKDGKFVYIFFFFSTYLFHILNLLYCLSNSQPILRIATDFCVILDLVL
jgi:hypothetical protein